MPRRLLLLLAVLVAVAAGCGSSAKPAANPATRGLDQQAATAIGTATIPGISGPVLVDGSGHALYLFAPDARKRVTCFNVCAATWPPAYAPAGKVATAGQVRPGLLGRDPDGQTHRSVLTYNGWPLYTYLPDVEPGMAEGQAINLDGGYWYVLRPDGSPVVPAGQPALPTS